MAELRLYKIIASGLILFMIVSGLMLFLSSGMEEYEVLNYNDSDLAYLQNASSQFKTIAPDYDNASSVEVAPDDPDKEGSILSRARSALGTTENSLTFFGKITSRLGSMLGLGAYGNVVSGVALALIVVVIVLGIFLAAVFRQKI